MKKNTIIKDIQKMSMRWKEKRLLTKFILRAAAPLGWDQRSACGGSTVVVTVVGTLVSAGTSSSPETLLRPFSFEM